MEFEENFQEAWKVIGIFEHILGARLNLDKSTIVLMYDGKNPKWFLRTGCKIA